MDKSTGITEGSLKAPTRHPLGQDRPEFWDEDALYKELERVYDICHGCRRCVSLCHAFPSLFDLVDASDTMEVDGVARQDYWKVVDHCYLCDLCYMTKCPYVPPHEWNLDFPHLMLRAKAVRFKKEGARMRDRFLSATDTVGRIAGIPVVSTIVNTANKLPPVRYALQALMGIHAKATLPAFHSKTGEKRGKALVNEVIQAESTEGTTGKVAIYVTCYGNRNEPHLVEDMVAVMQANNIETKIVEKTACCGMPKLELGDLDAIRRAKEMNIPRLAALVDEGYDIIAPVPSCALMFRQELPLMFPNDAAVKKVQAAFFDPFEYLALRHKAGKLNTGFEQPLGKVVYHAACHQRVQNIGPKTKEILSLIPDTQVEIVERCSGHDGTYAVKKESHEISMKICRPVVSRVKKAEADHYGSDCPMAGHQIENGLDAGPAPKHPISMLRMAYGL